MSELQKIWEQRWQEAQPISFLGRHMFRQKKKVLTGLLRPLGKVNVIDVGCGLGYTTALFRALGLNYLGIDISENAVEACRKKGLNVQLEDLKHVSGQYDLVFSDGMLEHFLNFEPYLTHLTRVSKQYVLLIQPNHGSFFGKTLVYLDELLGRGRNVFEYNYRIEDFIAKFSENDFYIDKNIPIFFDVFRLLLFKRKTGC